MDDMNTKKFRRDLADEEAINLHGFLSAQYENQKMKYGAFSRGATKWNVSERTVRRLWKRTTERAPGVTVLEAIRKKYKSKCGRKPLSKELISSKLKKVPLVRRSTLRSCAFATGFSKSALHRALKRDDVVKYRSYVKPLLTAQNRIDRVRFSISHIQENIPNMPFVNMKNIVHIDEKWFYLTRVKNQFYMCPEEELPQRATKSKRFIPKVMFLAAVARPRYDFHSKKYFDGKIGIWPFVHEVEAKRNSRNRPAGTMETKPLNVSAEVFTKLITTKVLPAIKFKWPGKSSSPIFIQQDNARPHTIESKKIINEEGTRDGWNIEMSNQPANSPDLNICDLGFFNTIQSLQSKKCATKVDQLIEAVLESFYETNPDSLNDNFITLQSVMREILINEGSNNFKIPHLKKSINRRKGTEITGLHCPVDVYKNAKTFLASVE